MPAGMAQAFETFFDQMRENLARTIENNVARTSDRLFTLGYTTEDLVIVGYQDSCRAAIANGKVRRWYSIVKLLNRIAYKLDLFVETRYNLAKIEIKDYDTSRIIRGLGLLGHPENRLIR